MCSQWLDRVKFGNGKDGAPATDINTNSGQGWGTVTGTAGQTTLSITDVAYCWRITAGDVILIHQSQGTGAGQWELNVASETFPNSTTATKSVQYPLTYNYGTGAQVIRVPQWTGGTLSGAAGTAMSWNGSYGGIYAVMCNGDLTVSGSISVNAIGCRGASLQNGVKVSGKQGEGYPNYNQSVSPGANGNGGGGGTMVDGQGTSGGGGGSNGGSGEAGHTYNVTSGQPGSTVGNAGLTSALFGGGGGSGSGGNTSGESGGAGGVGAGLIFIFAKNYTVSGSNTATGGNGSVGAGESAGGSGAGGSILIKCQTATLGTNKITASGGARISDNHYGGAGGVGRIHIDYYSGYTGTTTPTINAAQDTNLKSEVYSAMI